jgi:hypothetical protein
MFLSITSFLPALYAIVVEDQLDMEELSDKLFKQYPGLPLAMHQAYVLCTAIAVKELPIGTRVRVIQTYDTCALQVLGENTVVELWNKLPTKGLK